MAGFIGNLQLIIFLGILYMVAADELIDSHLIVLNERVSQVLRVLLLPSYVGITLLAIFMIFPLLNHPAPRLRNRRPRGLGLW